MKIAAIQMCSGPDVADNLKQARALIEQAAGAGAQLVALPEYFCLMGLRDTDKLQHCEALGSGPIQDSLALAARDCGVWLVGGTLPLKIAERDDQVFNSCLVFDPQGQQVARYDKIHLFRFDNGKEQYDEAKVLRAGHETTQLACTPAGSNLPPTYHVGLSICYDLRFPELYRQLSAKTPCDLIIVPAAFTYATGLAHWELLLRARAVENQCYVLAPAQGGVHPNRRHTYGHSMLIDPWGEVLSVRSEAGPGLVLGELDLARIAKVRQQLPALSHRVL